MDTCFEILVTVLFCRSQWPSSPPTQICMKCNYNCSKLGELLCAGPVNHTVRELGLDGLDDEIVGWSPA